MRAIIRVIVEDVTRADAAKIADKVEAALKEVKNVKIELNTMD